MSDFMAERVLTYHERVELARRAMSEAVDVRLAAGFDSDAPVPAWQIAEQLGVTVRFVDIDMEGFYRREPSPRILISNQRPLPRRNYTCGHELGHHVFGHGATLDQSLERTPEADQNDPNEVLVNAFSAHLLMPVLGVRLAFSSRKVKPETASPEDVLAVATQFGVGYETLVNQLSFAFGDLSRERRDALLAERHKLRKALVPKGEGGSVVLVDSATRLPTLDIEVEHIVVCPSDGQPDDDILVMIAATDRHRIFKAMRRGAVELSNNGKTWCQTMRIAKRKFVGLARFQYLSDPDGDEDDG